MTARSTIKQLFHVQNLKQLLIQGRHGAYHLLHAAAKLPDGVLEAATQKIGGYSQNDCPELDAHMRFTLALTNMLKQPVSVETLPKLRKLFALLGVSLQHPNRYDTTFSHQDVQTNTTQLINYKDKKITTADGDTIKLRCYQTDAANPEQVAMLFIHGGGFSIGNIQTHHEFCHEVCRQTHWPVISVDYRLAPEHAAPTAFYDCLDAYKYVYEHAQDFNILPKRIVVAGDSAGGCLTTLLAQTTANFKQLNQQDPSIDEDKLKYSKDLDDSYHNLPEPLAQLLLYPITDFDHQLAQKNYPSRTAYTEGFLLNQVDMTAFSNAYLPDNSYRDGHPFVSPMHGLHQPLCPALVVTAQIDLLHDEGSAYAKALEKLGSSVELYEVAGAPHGFLHLMSVHRPMQIQTDLIIKKFAQLAKRTLTDKPLSNI